MGPKRPAITGPSQPSESSNALVRRGARPDLDNEDLSKALVVHGGKRIVNAQTTTKALIKRAKETGGELILAKAITGPEKLRLKAETLAASAVREPFDLEELFRIADGQFQQQLTLIDQLQDPLFFCADIIETVMARPEFLTKPDALKNPAFVCSAIGSRIHNVYYMAGTWKQVLLLLREIKTITSGNLQATNIPKLLKARENFRDRYILLYRLMAMLVAVYQKSLAMATAASPLYSRYFQRRITDDEARSPYMTFRESEAMGPMKSLLDTIVMELVFPDSEYPLHILYLCLKDTLDSSPKDAGRFTQRIYDALGDLSETVRFLDMIATTLTGPDAKKWTGMVPPYTPAFDAYLDAEYLSIKASRDNVHMRPYVNPISKTEDAETLSLIWKNINLAYQKASGFDIDQTWQLNEDRKPSPQWSYTYDGSLVFDDDKSDYTDTDGEDEEDPNPMAVVLHKSRKGKKLGSYKNMDQPIKARKSRAITQGETGVNDSDEEPPDLVSASDDSDEDDGVVDEEEEEEVPSEHDSVYDSDEEAELERMFEQVMDADEDTIPELIDTWGQDANSSKKGKNPFVKLLKRLSGRMFSLDPTLNSRREFGPEPAKFTPPQKPKGATTKKPSAPHGEYSDMPELVRIGTSQTKGTTMPSVPQTTHSEPQMPGLQAPPSSDPELPRLVPSIPAATKKHKVTVEEVEDEDEAADKAKKKKKKKKKTKKAKGDGDVDDVASPEPAPAPLPTPAKSPPPPTKPKASNKPAPPPAAGSNQGFSFSSVSLHHPAGQSAQSARSYLAETGQINHLQKEKTRGEGSDTGEPSKQGFLAKISAAVKGTKTKDEPKKVSDKENQLPRFSISKKAGKLMNRLFNKDELPKSMKWDHFVKALVQMGFEYHPETAGSSVRFDPPSKNDRPIHFHKPHPDSTINPVMLQAFRKKLEKYYGWTPEQFIDFDEAAQVEEID